MHTRTKMAMAATIALAVGAGFANALPGVPISTPSLDLHEGLFVQDLLPAAEVDTPLVSANSTELIEEVTETAEVVATSGDSGNLSRAHLAPAIALYRIIYAGCHEEPPRAHPDEVIGRYYVTHECVQSAPFTGHKDVVIWVERATWTFV